MSSPAMPVDGGASAGRPRAVAGDEADTTRWQRVVLPAEHGGWGLTLEPVLLGLLAAWSVAGLCLGVAALLAFLVRTPLKLAAVDVRRGRWLARSGLAVRVAALELLLLGSLVAVATATGSPRWWWAVLVAAPLATVEWVYDVRSRGRRLVPELAGSVAIAGTAATVVLAGSGSVRTAVGVWLLLAGRSVAAIPFVRVQIARLRRGVGDVRSSDRWQLIGLAFGVAAASAQRRLAAGAVVLALLLVLHVVQSRRAPVPAKRLGVAQMSEGLALVVLAGIGLHL